MALSYSKIQKFKLLIVMLVGAVWPVFPNSTFAQTAAMTQVPPSAIEIWVQNGLLTANVINAPLADVLIRIGSSAGFKTVLYGDLKSQITLSLADVPLIEGIRRLVGNRSVALIQLSTDGPEERGKQQTITELWVFEADGKDAAQKRVAFDTEPTEAGLEVDMSEGRADKARVPEGSYYTGSRAKMKLIQQEHQSDEDTEIGMWRRVLAEEPNWEIRQLAVTELAKIGSDSALDAMATAIGDDSVAVRRSVTENLGLVGGDLSTRLLGQVLLSEPNSEIRLIAVKILADQRTEISRAFLTTAAKDPDHRVKMSAAQALKHF